MDSSKKLKLNAREMFSRIHRHKSDKLGHKIHFNFSTFLALKVPKGWDKLVVSIISVETGKTTAKSAKATVQNGHCLWQDTLSESILISEADASKEHESYLYKFVISTGSVKSTILGEATINLADYMDSKTTAQVSLPLKKCNYGTNLQVRIQCLTPREKGRGEQWTDTSSNMEDANSDFEDLENKSDVSDITFTRSAGSFSSNQLDISSHPGETGSRDTNSSATGSRYSFESDSSLGRESMSPLNKTSGPMRQDSTGSQNGQPYGSYSFDEPSRTNHSSFNSKIREDSRRIVRASSSSPLHPETEAEEVTREELRAQAKMWERNARKLMLDLEALRKEVLDQSKKHDNLETELSASETECDGLKQEVKQLKSLLEEAVLKQEANDSWDIQKELENEIRFQKESNADLALQLEKTQESSIELVSILQELEDTVEKQKMEIENLLSIKSNENLGHGDEDGKEVDEREDLLHARESQQEMENTIRELEKCLEGKIKERENERSLMTQTLSERDAEWRSKLAAKEEEIVHLEEKLAKARNDQSSNKLGHENGGDVSRTEEIEALKEKIQELENDCNELTDENLDLLYKLKESSKDRSFGSSSNEDPLTSNELASKQSEIEDFKDALLLKEQEIEDFETRQKELETQISNIEKEKGQLEENMKILQRESSITSKCLDDIRDSQVSAHKILERKSTELESGKRELEIHLEELEEENVNLSERISGMEAQLRYLTDERESQRLELQISESRALNLEDEIKKLEAEMEAQKADMKQKLQDMQKRWLEAQEECEYLKRANPKLQATAESLIEECSLVQKSNQALKNQKMELHEQCAALETQVRESQKRFSDLSDKVDALEAQLSSMLDEVDSKDKLLFSELDELVSESKKLGIEESRVQQMYLEKKVEVENLQREVTHLTEQISATCDERERTASDAVLEVSNLRADKANLETAFHEIREKLRLSADKVVESESRVSGLLNELAGSTKKHEFLLADHVKLQGTLENFKLNEEKLKTTIAELELKLKTVDYERQQLVDEISGLKVQLQQKGFLQDEVLALKSSLNDVKFENERLEASCQLLSGDCEEMKAERVTFIEKIAGMQRAMSELEDCRRSKLGLEEKILRLDGDLVAREALCAQDAELKNDLGRIRRSNSELQRKIKYLEEEKEEWLKRAQALEEELKLKIESEHDRSSEFSSISTSNPEEVKTLKEEQNKSTELNENQLKESPTEPDQLQLSNGQPDLDTDQHQKEADQLLKIQFLQNELAEALEANNMYKDQLKSLLSENPDEVKEGNDGQSVSLLEAELKEMRERYFQVSLKYAEVEAQREELVLKLKTVSKGRNWFS